MPTDFPDLDSLKYAAGLWKFRQPNDGESESDYRFSLANFVEPQDYIESLEIRNKVGWDRFSAEQNKDMLRRRGVPI